MTKQQFSALAKKCSNEELADSFIFPSQLTKKQKSEADAELRHVLEQRRAAKGANDHPALTASEPTKKDPDRKF